jgi:hypothetical protein
VVEVDQGATRVLRGFADRLVALKQQILGTASATLCYARVPGSTQHLSPSTAECAAATREQGSAATQVVAEAFLFASRRAVISFQNAGGVRASIPGGRITYETVLAALPFSNTMFELDMTGWEVRETLEAALDFVLTTGATGAYPYAAGLRWCLDPFAPRGARFSRLQVRDKAAGPGAGADRWSDLVAGRTYVIVTSDYLAGGRDGYTPLKAVLDAGRGTNAYIYYAQGLVDYVVSWGRIKPPAASDYSLKTAAMCATQNATIGLLLDLSPDPAGPALPAPAAALHRTAAAMLLAVAHVNARDGAVVGTAAAGRVPEGFSLRYKAADAHGSLGGAVKALLAWQSQEGLEGLACTFVAAAAAPVSGAAGVWVRPPLYESLNSSFRVQAIVGPRLSAQVRRA